MFCWSSHRNISTLNNFHSFKLRKFSIVPVCFCLAHSSHCNFFNTMPRSGPVGVIYQPFNSGSGADHRLVFICCVGRHHPQIHEVWTFANDGITRKIYPFVRVDVGAFSRECFKTDYFAENGCRVSINENPLTRALSGSAFFALVVIMDCLELRISCVPVRFGETEVLLKLVIGIVNLAVSTALLMSCDMETSLTVRLAFLGVRKMRAPLRVVSVTFSFGSIFWRSPKVSRITGKSSARNWSFGPIAPWKIFWMKCLLNIFCKFPSVV